MWSYPWDARDVGPAALVRELRERAGVDGISLAASYHAGRFLRPRAPAGKVYFPEDGTIYFEPQPERWASSRLRPAVARILESGDVLRDLVAAREATGIAVNAWTVCLHNMRLGLLHPDVCTVGAFGDVNPFSLCPSHPDARAYAVALVADLTHAYRPDSVELETPCFLPYAHGYHHEKDGVGLLPEDDFLLSLCFCDACVMRSGRAGVDADAARRRVVALVTAALERPIPAPRWPDFSAEGPAALSEFPELQHYAEWRSEPVTSLVAEIRAAAHPDSKVYLVDVPPGWVTGCDHAAIAAACDGLILCAYDLAPDAVGRMIAAGRAAAGADKYLAAGFRVIHPEMADAADLAAKVGAARAAGADGLNFYNYGLIPAARLDWIRHALA